MSYEVGNSTCCNILCDEVDGVQVAQFIRKLVRVCDPGGQVTTEPQDFELDGSTPYIVQGTVVVCNETVQLEAGLADLNGNDTFGPADVPIGKVITGLTMTVVGFDVATTVTDTNSNILTNIPAGITLSWNAEDANTMDPPTISVGPTGRVIVNYTVK